MASSRKFSKVSPAVWGSARFVGLPSSDTKLLYLYFITCEHVTSAGAYRIKKGYALTDLCWTDKQYREALGSLVTAELVAYDEPNETIYVLRWFQHNPPQNEKHAQGTRRLIEQLDSETIAELAMMDFEEADSRRNPVPAPQSTSTSPTLRQQLTQFGGQRF